MVPGPTAVARSEAKPRPRRRPLPFRTEPSEDESWHSYLSRVAREHDCSLADLAVHLGVRDARKGRWPAYFGVTIDEKQARRAAWSLNLTAKQVHEMQLAKYDQIAVDLSPLDASDGINSTRLASQRSWVHLAGTAYCPRCLAEAPVWAVKWRLPWTTVCHRHQVFLEHQCPECHAIPGLRSALHATAPSGAAGRVAGHRCTHPYGEADAGERGPGVCGADLRAATSRTAPADAMRRSRHIAELVAGNHGEVAGEKRRPMVTLQAWRYAACLARHLGRVPEIDWGETHRWTLPPRDPRTMDALLAAAEPVVCAPDAKTAADVLANWCCEAGHSSIHADLFRRASKGSEHLGDVISALLRRDGRAHVLAQRRLSYEVGDLLSLDVDHVPQLLWPCALPDRLRASTKPDTRILRAVQALIVVRTIAGSPDWGTTGELLGIPAHRAKQWTRYCFGSAHGSLKDELISSAHRVARVLARTRHREEWAERPQLFGAGLSIFALAQSGRCRRDDPTTAWCPCIASSSAPTVA